MEFKLQSDSLAALLPCWKDAQLELSKGITKDKAAYNFNYSTLEQMQEFGEPILNKHDLALNICRFPFEGNYYLQTRIYHVKSSEFFASYSYLYPINLTTLDPKAQQNLGAILSYQARYDLRTILCLPCKCEDADEKKYSKTNSEQNVISKEQADELLKICGGSTAIAKEVAKQFNVGASYYILEDDYDQALEVARVLTSQKGKK